MIYNLGYDIFRIIFTYIDESDLLNISHVIHEEQPRLISETKYHFTDINKLNYISSLTNIKYLDLLDMSLFHIDILSNMTKLTELKLPIYQKSIILNQFPELQKLSLKQFTL